jgi:hypothetical protein
MKKNAKELVGLFFHSVDQNGRIKWQGRIESSPEPGWYLVQLFEWGFGCDSSKRVVRIESMERWIFYSDSKSMCESWENGEAFLINQATKENDKSH